VRSPAARLTGIAISTALAVVFGWFAAVYGIASLSPDGTWTDTVSFLAFTALTLGCGALAWGGVR
jgi:hypothetical protein